MWYTVMGVTVVSHACRVTRRRRDNGKDEGKTMTTVPIDNMPGLAGKREGEQPVPVAQLRKSIERRNLVTNGTAASGLSFLVMLSLLFQPQIGSLAPAFATAVFVVYCALAHREAYKSLAGSALIFALPGLALLSYLWSDDPSSTAYYGTQYLITILIGMMIGSSTHRLLALDGLFYAWAIYCFSSSIFGHSVGWNNVGTAFAGLNRGKNYAADTAVLGAIFSLYFISRAAGRGSMLLMCLGVAALLNDIYIVSIARSSGAVVGLSQSMVLFAALLFARKLELHWRVGIALTALCAALFAVVTYPFWGPRLLAATFDFFGKDPTLTGRLYLWTRADELIASQPVLGAGYEAFWRQGNLDAEGLWRYAGISSRMGFNFHHTPTELLVSLGWVGLVTFGAVFALYSVRLIWQTLQAPNHARITWTVVICYEFGRMFYESVGQAPFAFSTILVAAAMASGARQRSDPTSGAPAELLSHPMRRSPPLDGPPTP